MHLALDLAHFEWVNNIQAGEHHDDSECFTRKRPWFATSVENCSGGDPSSRSPEMLRRLAEYKLGIFMPHMHDEQTGEFQPLPDEVMQVESGLEVSFQPTEEIVNQTDRFLPVGWLWRAGASTPLAVCEMVCEERPGDTERYVKHKMPNRN